MTTQILIWNRVICKNIRNEDYASSLPDLIAHEYRGRLAHEIQSMARKNPISFESAVQLVHEKCQQAWDANDLKRYIWLPANFVEYISDCGYHIELSGDEFEPTIVPNVES